MNRSQFADGVQFRHGPVGVNPFRARLLGTILLFVVVLLPLAPIAHYIAPSLPYVRDGVNLVLLIGTILLYPGLWQGRSLPYLAIIGVVGSSAAALAIATGTTLAGIIQLKWLMIWTSAHLIGILVGDGVITRRTLLVALGFWLGYCVASGTIGLYEFKTNSFLINISYDQETLGGIELGKSQVLESSVRQRGLERDTFCFANSMAMAFVLGLGMLLAPGLGTWRIVFALPLPLFLLATFVSSGRSGLIGLIVGATMLIVARLLCGARSLVAFAIGLIAAGGVIALNIGVGTVTSKVGGLLLDSYFIANDESAHMRDTNWRHLLDYYQSLPLGGLLGYPQLLLFANAELPPIGTTDNVVLFLLINVGMIGLVVVAAAFFRILYRDVRAADKRLFPVTVGLISFVAAEAIIRDSVFFLGVVPCIIAISIAATSLMKEGGRNAN